MEIHVSRGTEKPYYLVSKGPVSSGVFIRIGRSSRSATQDEIVRMMVQSRDFSFESNTSPNQKLSFVQFGLFANEAKLDVNAAKYITLGLKNNAKEYSNLGLLVSDENPVYVKFAVYQGKTRTRFLDKKEFRGSIIKIAKSILDFSDMLNEKHIEIVNYQPERVETRSYPEIAIRETVLNAICHTDYARPAQIKIEFFDDRLEISSPGNIYGGVTLE